MEYKKIEEKEIARITHTHTQIPHNTHTHTDTHTNTLMSETVIAIGEIYYCRFA